MDAWPPMWMRAEKQKKMNSLNKYLGRAVVPVRQHYHCNLRSWWTQKFWKVPQQNLFVGQKQHFPTLVNARRKRILRHRSLFNSPVLFKLIRRVCSQSTLPMILLLILSNTLILIIGGLGNKTACFSLASPCVSPRRCWITVKLIEITHNLAGLLAFALVFLQNCIVRQISWNRFDHSNFISTVTLSLTTCTLEH